ncbi:hypothetical protein WR25_19452 [Diploscapter pachys]|uniref:Uncharacterized protein n=1 Tax=Diploscapter pachys TaxID=2018661 RepID=A0A2A2M4X3_9BILA|nr:hypothetical protein WR25_19452 [Diploscapter pachys]
MRGIMDDVQRHLAPIHRDRPRIGRVEPQHRSAVHRDLRPIRHPDIAPFAITSGDHLAHASLRRRIEQHARHQP